MSLLCAALSLLLALPGAAAPPRPKHFSASLDKQRITLGEPFTLTLEITHAAADTYALPQPLTVGELSLRGQPGVARQATPEGDAVTTFKLPLVDLKTLDPRVPDLTLAVDGPEGARTFTVPGRALTLASVIEPDGPDGKKSKEVGPRAPKRPVPIFIKSWLWAVLLASAIVFGVLLYLAAKLGKKAKEARDLRNIPLPPEAADEALHRIAMLRARKPWEKGLGRAAIFELSEIVRVYLGRRLSFDTLDLTSDELLTELRRRRILGLDLSELTEELQWEDLVKFAKLEPTGPECSEALEKAKELIDRTRPMVPKSPEKAAKAGEARA